MQLNLQFDKHCIHSPHTRCLAMNNSKRNKKSFEDELFRMELAWLDSNPGLTMLELLD